MNDGTHHFQRTTSMIFGGIPCDLRDHFRSVAVRRGRTMKSYLLAMMEEVIRTDSKTKIKPRRRSR